MRKMRHESCLTVDQFWCKIRLFPGRFLPPPRGVSGTHHHLYSTIHTVNHRETLASHSTPNTDQNNPKKTLS